MPIRRDYITLVAGGSYEPNVLVSNQLFVLPQCADARMASPSTLIRTVATVLPLGIIALGAMTSEVDGGSAPTLFVMEQCVRVPSRWFRSW